MSHASEARIAHRSISTAPDLLNATEMDHSDAKQSFAVMEAIGAWQEAGRSLAKLSAQYMQLNETDMRAIRMLIAAGQRNEIVTPKDIASTTGISSASTTKLVNRLIAAGHVTRSAHPTDRRTTVIEVTAPTRLVARDTIGRQHARRFAVAAALNPAERETVVKFLNDMVLADQPQQAFITDDRSEQR